MADHNNDKRISKDSDPLVVELIHEEKRSDLKEQCANDNEASDLKRITSKIPRRSLLLMKEVLEKFSLRFK
jgi:hypothetical protein